MGKENKPSDEKGIQAGSRMLQVTQVTDTSITIKWEKFSEAEATGKIRYQVQISKWDEPDEWRIVEEQEGIDTYTFTGLKPKTKYGFFVDVLDEHGKVLCTFPDNSDKHLEQTTMAEDTQPPTVKSRSIKVSNKSNTGFTISWNKASDKVTTDPNKIRYKVGLYEYNNPDETFSYVKEEFGITSCEFTDLKPDTEYGFCVEAYDEAGNMLRYPSDREDITCKTLPTDSKPPQIDKKSLRVTKTTDTSILIKWERAQDDLTPSYEIHYQVRIKEADNTNDVERILIDEPDIASFEITGLKPETNYSIYVDAVDSVGNTSTYKKISAKTKATDSEPPQVASHSLNVTEITDTGFTITWEKAKDKVTPDDKIRYVVKIIDYDSDEPTRIVEDAVRIGTFTFTDLEPETKYGVCVEAIDEAGNECFYPDEEIGYLIVTTKATDKEDPKVKSKKLIVSNVTTKSFVVSWEKATDDVTLDANIRYHLVLLALDNPEDPTIVIEETKTDIDTYTFTGLKPETQYAVLVEAYDEVDKKVMYTDNEDEMTTVTTLEEKDTEKPKATSYEINADDITGTSITLSWQAATDNKTAQSEIKYDVYQDSKCIKQDLTSASSPMTYKVENLASGKQYNFYVVAKDKAGNKTNYLTKTVETLDTTAPTVSSKEISATSITANSITLSWQAATDNKTAQSEIKYDVYQDSKCIKQNLTSASSTVTYKVENLASGIQYSFYVVAKDKAGNKTNYLTKTVETLDAIAPTVSSKVINATSITANSIMLSWQAATDNKTAQSEIKYDVYQDSKCIKQDLTSASSPVTYKVENLASGKQYNFYVVAKDKAGNKTNYLTRTVETLDVIAPTVSSKVINATSITANSITLSWQAATDNKTAQSEIKYDVYQDSKCIKQDLTSASSTVTYKVENLASGKQYSFYVVAKDKAGNKTNYLTKTVETIDVIAPTANSDGITANEITGTSITLSWPAATDNKTAQSEIVYDVYKGANCVASLKGCTTYKALNLSPSCLYSFYVVAKDKAGNKKNYSTKAFETLDTIAPTVSSKEIRATNITANSITLSWNAATDNKTPQKNIVYCVYQGNTLIKFGVGMTSYTVKGLSPNTSYSFYVVAKDQSANQTTYPSKTFKTKLNKLFLELNSQAEPLRGTNTVQCCIDWEYYRVDNNGTATLSNGTSREWSNKSIQRVEILLPEGCYFKNDYIKITLRTKLTKISSWKTSKSGYVRITGDHMKIKIDGYYLKNKLYLTGESEGYAQFM